MNSTQSYSDDDIQSNQNSDCSMISTSSYNSNIYLSHTVDGTVIKQPEIFIGELESDFDLSFNQKQINDVENDIQGQNDNMNIEQYISSDAIITEDDLIKNCVKHNQLIVVLFQYLTIEMIFIISSLIRCKFIKQSNLISRFTLFTIYQSIIKMETNPDIHILDFASCLLNDCYKDTTPFFFPRLRSVNKCNTMQSLFRKFGCIYSFTGHQLNTNYISYFLFKLKEFQLWHLLFKNSPLAHYVKLFLPFTCNNIKDSFIHSMKLHEFRNYVTSIRIKSKRLERVFSSLWFRYHITNEYTTGLQVYQDKDDIIDYLQNNYAYYIWMRWIDWKSFFIGGDAILSALIDLHPSQNSHINIFSFELGLYDFYDKMTEFQMTLRKHDIRHHLYQLSDSIFTFILMLHRGSRINVPQGVEFKLVTIQFLWTCKMTSISQTILNFSLGAGQIAFQPYPVNRIHFTDAFLYFLKSSQCIVYKPDVNRIRRYQDKGINNYLFKSKTDLLINKHNVILGSPDYLKIQLNDNEPVYVNFNKRSFLTNHCVNKNQNLDDNNLLKKFISSI